MCRQMATSTTPTATDKRFVWDCTCGRHSASITTEAKAIQQAREHEQYCMWGGETEVREVVGV